MRQGIGHFLSAATHLHASVCCLEIKLFIKFNHGDCMYCKVKRMYVFLAAIVCAASMFYSVYAEGLDIYGYGQIMGQNQKNFNSSTATGTGSAISSHSTTTFSIQEIDLFLHKNFTPTVSCLVDLQFLNSYSTQNKWGDLNLDEAWVKFSPSRLFELKVGYIVPIFNNFNEVKTKFPIFPYIQRPLVYESSMGTIMGSAFLPLHAAAQISGTASAGSMKLDYAIYGGNSEFMQTGTKDSSNYKAGGMRVGLRGFDLKFGVSATYDYCRNDQINSTISRANSMPGSTQYSLLGSTPRGRVGLDLSYSKFGLTLESEFIYVKELFTDGQKTSINNLVSGKVFTGADLSMYVAFGTITYDFLDRYFVFAGYATALNPTMGMADPLKSPLGGAGIRINDNVTVKLQETYVMVSSNMKMLSSQAAVSFYF
jgi:hypothetical protein